jgi:hypothetical protein
MLIKLFTMKGIFNSQNKYLTKQYIIEQDNNIRYNKIVSDQIDTSSIITIQIY